ncbi:MAG: DUF3300 domain-containing protein, partial [Candidatus Acidiferrales bacterium]
CKSSEKAPANMNGQEASEAAQAQQAQLVPATTAATPTPDELYQLVAPIALFPDNLVAQVLAGSTYPDQITAANAWLQQNSSLKGDQLMQAVDQQPWDVSVKALTQFPDVLNQMATNLSWTSALGDAYYNIPQDVMNAVQVMRQRAQQAGNLKSNTQQNVSVENQAPAAAPAPPSSGAPQPVIVQAPPQTIIIQPAQPQVVYVPTYNPTVVYGAPVAPYPGYSSGQMAAASIISFGVGIAVGAAIANNNHCCGWGWNSWGCGWHSSTVVYNRNVYVSNSNTFVNRNNYYNRNVSHYNQANINRTNVNVNNVNRNNINNINTNNVNRNNLNNNNYRANNFNNTAHNNLTTPNFNQKYNQPQYNNNRGNAAQTNRPQTGAPQANRAQGGAQQPNRPQAGGQQTNRPQTGTQQPSFNQQNRAGTNQNQSRPNNVAQPQRDAARGYGQAPSQNSSKSTFSNYSPGGNTRTNSARGGQSLEANGGAASRPQPQSHSRAGGGRRK